MTEVPSKLEDILDIHIVPQRKDPIFNQQSPTFMRRKLLLKSVYKEKPPKVKPVTPAIEYPKVREVAEDLTPKICYYKRTQRLKKERRSSSQEYDQVYLKQELFLKGHASSIQTSPKPSSLPNYQNYTRTKKNSSVKPKKKTEKYVRRKSDTYNPRPQISKVLSHLLHASRSPEQFSVTAFPDKWNDHARDLSTRSVLSREQIRKEISDFTFHRETVKSPHKSICNESKTKTFKKRKKRRALSVDEIPSIFDQSI